MTRTATVLELSERIRALRQEERERRGELRAAQLEEAKVREALEVARFGPAFTEGTAEAARQAEGRWRAAKLTAEKAEEALRAVRRERWEATYERSRRVAAVEQARLKRRKVQ